MAELGFNLGLLVSESLSATSVNYCIPKKVKMSVSQSCLTLCDPMYCSLQGSSVHGILQQEYQSGLPFPSLGDCD